MLQFVAPFSLILTGPTRCGKTTFIVNLIKNLKCIVGGIPIKHVLWCYKHENSIPLELKNISFVKFHKNVPTDINEISANTLIIFDDLMMDSFSKEITEIFTVTSHHNNISIILVMHNLFFKNKHTRNITLNTQYIVYFKNPRDLSSISHLTRQIDPSNSKNLQTLFNDVTKQPHSYIVIDLTQETPEILKYRTDIFNKTYINCFTTQSAVDNYNNNGAN